MTPINLIPNDRLRTARRRRRLRAWVRTLVGYTACLAVFGVGVGALIDRSDRVLNLDTQIERFIAEVDTADRGIAEVTPQIGELRLAVETAEAVAQQPNWGVLLALLAESKGAQLVFERCRLEPILPARRNAGTLASTTREVSDTEIGYRLFVDGFGHSQREVSDFALTLERAGLFDRIDVKQTQRAQLMGRSVTSFQMEGLLNGQGEQP